MAEAPVKLRVISRYVCRDVVHEVGHEWFPSEAEMRFLMADAPGCFEIVQPKPPAPAEPEVRAPERPPRNRAILEPRGRK